MKRFILFGIQTERFRDSWEYNGMFMFYLLQYVAAFVIELDRGYPLILRQYIFLHQLFFFP